MSKIAAINLSADKARIVTAESSENSIILTDFHSFELDDYEIEAEDQKAILDSFTQIESSVAQLSSTPVIYRQINLPFNDTKKIDKTAPIQLQDQIPVELDEFIVDSIVLDKKEDGTYDILTSATSSDIIEKSLKVSQSIGLDPKFITTKASSASSLKELFSLRGSFALLEISNSNISITIFENDKLIFLKDINDAYLDGYVSQSCLEDLVCTLVKHEVNKTYALGNSEIIENLSEHINIDELNLNKVIVNQTDIDLEAEDISWAIGLIESDKNKNIFDFRVGKYSGKHLLNNIIAALKEEYIYILGAIIALLIWLALSYYRSLAGLSYIDDTIYKIAKEAAPNLSITRRNELSTLENSVAELEEQLSGMGSLSSLSPLEVLLELTKTIDNKIDIKIDSLGIAESKVSFRGSVADTPTVGRLNSALEKNKNIFCKIKVDPGGRTLGNSRVRFSAEIILCK